MKTKVTTITAALLIGFISFQCKEPVREKVDLVKSWQLTYEDTISGYNISRGGAAEGNGFSRADNKFPFGSGLVWQIPDSLLGKELRVNIDCFVRKGESNAKHGIVVSFNSADTTAFWTRFEADSVTAEKDKWVHLIDSAEVLPLQSNKKGLEMRIYGWNAAGTTYFDVDDLKISLKKVQILADK